MYELVKTGNLCLEIKFARPLPHTVYVVVLAVPEPHADGHDTQFGV